MFQVCFSRKQLHCQTVVSPWGGVCWAGGDMHAGWWAEGWARSGWAMGCKNTAPDCVPDQENWEQCNHT
eukprot:15464535-Alexandrium_andersonii.AAC.1